MIHNKYIGLVELYFLLNGTGVYITVGQDGEGK